MMVYMVGKCHNVTLRGMNSAFSEVAWLAWQARFRRCGVVPVGPVGEGHAARVNH